VLQHREDDLVLWRGAGISSQDFTFVLGDVIAGGTSAAPLPINRGDPKANDRSISF
jgi:hypothetical protein